MIALSISLVASTFLVFVLGWQALKLHHERWCATHDLNMNELNAEHQTQLKAIQMAVSAFQAELAQLRLQLNLTHKRP